MSVPAAAPAGRPGGLCPKSCASPAPHTQRKNRPPARHGAGLSPPSWAPGLASSKLSPVIWRCPHGPYEGGRRGQPAFRSGVGGPSSGAGWHPHPGRPSPARLLHRLPSSGRQKWVCVGDISGSAENNPLIGSIVIRNGSHWRRQKALEVCTRAKRKLTHLLHVNRF